MKHLPHRGRRGSAHPPGERNNRTPLAAIIFRNKLESSRFRRNQPETVELRREIEDSHGEPSCFRGGLNTVAGESVTWLLNLPQEGLARYTRISSKSAAKTAVQGYRSRRRLPSRDTTTPSMTSPAMPPVCSTRFISSSSPLTRQVGCAAVSNKSPWGTGAQGRSPPPDTTPHARRQGLAHYPPERTLRSNVYDARGSHCRQVRPPH